MVKRRKDSKNRVLKTGESERKQGGYQYRWTSTKGKRQYIYASTLSELREKEKEVKRDLDEGINTNRRNFTLNDMYFVWLDLKKGLKANTLSNYTYMYERFVKNDIGKQRLINLKQTDIRRFYNRLVDQKGLKPNTLDTIQLVIHQILNLAVEDDIIRRNISDNGLRELKRVKGKQKKKKALTVKQQERFISYIRNSPKYHHWYPTFAVMLGTGLRVGELTGLRWKDVDLKHDFLSVNHTLVLYKPTAEKHSKFIVNTPKTKAGNRSVPLIETVKDAFIIQKNYLKDNDIVSVDVIDGYSDFVFINRFGGVQHQGTLNKAIKRIIIDANLDLLDSNDFDEECLLPDFSCHTLRHTFTTRLIEAGTNIKVIQEALGHSDIETTLNVYADVTRDMKRDQFEKFNDFMKK